MKQAIKDLICRWFGHKDFDEVYCVKSYNWFCRQNKPNLYDVVHDVICSRCGRKQRVILKSKISRAQLLRDGWFLTDESPEILKPEGLHEQAQITAPKLTDGEVKIGWIPPTELEVVE